MEAGIPPPHAMDTAELAAELASEAVVSVVSGGFTWPNGGKKTPYKGREVNYKKRAPAPQKRC